MPALAAALLEAKAGPAEGAELALCLVDRLALNLSLARASLAVRRGRGARLVAISGQTRVDVRRQLPRTMITVLDKVHAAGLVQASSLQASGLGFGELLVHGGSDRAMVLGFQGRYPGSVELLLEWRDAGAVSTAAFQQRLAEALSASLRPAVSLVDEQLWREQPLVSKLREYWQRGLALRTAGMPLAPTRRQLVAALVALVCLLGFLPVPLKVPARAVVEAVDRQVVAAPQDGVIASAHVRAGDRVVKGQVLAALDRRELELGLQRWQGEADRNRQHQAEALAARDRIRLATLRAEATRIEAELGLAKSRLDRAELRAPFDGTVLSGDLSQSLGAAVRLGDTLFTLAASHDHRLVLEVDEHDVGLVESGQSAEVRLVSMPGEKRLARLERMEPVAVETRGASVFRLPARLVTQSDALHVGMEGVARIRVGTASVWAAWTRPLRQQLRLWCWKLGLWT